jgi:hypothetical protein
MAFWSESYRLEAKIDQLIYFRKHTTLDQKLKMLSSGVLLRPLLFSNKNKYIIYNNY